MASLSTVNNSACHHFPFDPNKLCNTAADYCDTVSTAVTITTLAIALPLITLAGEMLVEGVIDSILMIKDLGKRCCNRKEKDLPNQNEEMTDVLDVFHEENHQSREVIIKERVAPVWKRVFGTLKLVTTAVALGAIATVTYKFGTLFSNNNCQSIRDGCSNFSTDIVDACNWVDGFLVNVIEQVIERYL